MSKWRNRIIETRTVTADELRGNPSNWRKHPDAQAKAIRGLLNEVGIVAPLIAYESQRYGGLVLIDGHMRQETGGEWPVTILDVTDEEADLILSVYDPITGLAEMDADALAELLERVEMTPVEDEGVSALLAQLADEAGVGPPKSDVDAEPQIDRAEELREQWGVQLGQLWQLGDHRLICGDCTDADVVARLMDGEKAACMWTDPPYGVSYVGKTKDALTIDNDGAEDLPRLLRECFASADTILVEGAPIYVAHPPGALQFVFGKAFLDAGWKFHEELVWVKDSMVLGHSDYHLKHEGIHYGWKGKNRTWYVGRDQVSVFEIDRPSRSEEHPTMKPPELVIAMLRNSTRATDVVYEPFSGSGTTLLACESLGRQCRAVEISPGYVAVALERWATATGQTPVLLEAVHA